MVGYIDQGRFSRDWKTPFYDAGPGLIAEIDARRAALTTNWRDSNGGKAAAALRAAAPNLFLVNFGTADSSNG